MKDGIIFDLDGTLVDSLADIAGAVNAVLRSRGAPQHSTEAYRGFIGDGLVALVRRALGDTNDEGFVASIVEEVRSTYAHRCTEQTRPYDGVVPLLTTLRRAGHPLSVVSNKPHALTRRVVDELFDPGTFAFVTGERDGVPRKPDPSGALQAASVMERAPAACWFVGDLPVDLHTADAAGMRGVAVGWGLGETAVLEELSPHAVLAVPRELLDVIG